MPLQHLAEPFNNPGSALALKIKGAVVKTCSDIKVKMVANTSTGKERKWRADAWGNAGEALDIKVKEITAAVCTDAAVVAKLVSALDDTADADILAAVVATIA